MKKIFAEAEVEVKAFELEDIITASSGTEGNGNNGDELPAATGGDDF